MRRHPTLGLFITVYDGELINSNERFKDKSYSKVVDEIELRRVIRDAVSIIFYGWRCISIGIEEKLIHPEAVSKQYGVDVAIYIDVR